MKGDTPIKLVNISEMDDQDIDALILNIRERRMRPVEIYNEMTLMQAASRREQLETTLNKHLGMFEKELDRADRAMSKLEQRSTKLRALKLELEAT